MSIEKELELINSYSRKKLEEKDVYIFSLTLCDNDIDRDFERFTKDTLDGLGLLFLGKAGIFDHNMKAQGQSARIFKTWVEAVPEKKTIDGEAYYRLCAKAYMVRTEKNKALIDEIDGGIKKEVSVGCAVRENRCSVCSKDRRKEGCEHIRGKEYSGKLCYGILEKPFDAYEWSFVAVPSQREAGVTKSFISSDEITKILKKTGDSFSLSKEQANGISSYIAQLEETKKEADFFKEKLLEKLKKYTLLAFPEIDTDGIISAFKKMETAELLKLSENLEQQISKIQIPLVQLGVKKNSRKQDNGAFKI